MTTPRRAVSARALIATLLVALAACSAQPVGLPPAGGSSPEDREPPGDDDGNGPADCAGASCAAVPGDGSRCGNGRVERGEQCDDGRNNGPDRRCNAVCKLNVCGDGDTRIGVEQCDGGNGTPRDTATCDADCTLPTCGDGHVNAAAGEQCDDGANNGGPGSVCTQFCQLARCGDGILEQGEQCDSGTGSDTATCDADCTIAVCGDGYVNLAAGEQCDDGNNISGDGCSAACRLE
jgi:cysteine-rich repeat protein